MGMQVRYLVWRRGNLSVSSFIKEHYAFHNIVISKGMDINNSHGELWGVMDSSIFIIYDLQIRLVVMNSHSHGAYMVCQTAFQQMVL